MEGVIVVERKRPVTAGDLVNRICLIFSLHKHTQLHDFRFPKYTLNVGLQYSKLMYTILNITVLFFTGLGAFANLQLLHLRVN
jgi:hypothetical protein